MGKLLLGLILIPIVIPASISYAVEATKKTPAAATAVTAQELEAAETTTTLKKSDMTVTVVGSKDVAWKTLGSAAYFDAADIAEFTTTDINRILRQAPGVYVREEDGYGNFPNISLRGVTTVRNTRVTVMEDGILSAPAPYSDPAAYYSPAIGRMHGLEILKASSQVKYGPQVSGGVINYLSTPVPEEQRTYLKSTYGSDNEVFVLGNHGNTVTTDAGNFGYLAEMFYHRTDGFKTIDSGPGVNRDQTGFERIEPMLKLFWEPDGTVYNRFEAKFGYTDFEADETYLGLTESDFRENPNRRYSSTRFDNIDTEHYRTYLRHIIEPTEDWRVTTTGYFNYFKRAWYKLNDARVAGGFKPLSETLAGQHGAAELNLLKGTQAGELRVRNNNRAYFGAGLDHTHKVTFETGQANHTLEGGYRLHYDQAKRFQNDDIYTMDGGGNVTNITFGAPGSQDDRLAETWAHAFHIQDTIKIGALTLTPGMRYEHLDISRTDRRPGGVLDKSGTHDLYAGGMGIGYEVNREFNVFGSAYRGFSIPTPNDSLDNDLGPESSIAAEVGARYDNQTGFSVEGIFFTTFYEDLVVANNTGGGGGGNTENAGAVDVYGFELAAAYDHGESQGWPVRTPARVAFTYTDARFSSPASAQGGGGGGPNESIFSGAARGNRVPYIPEYQVTATVGLEYDRYSLSLIGTFVPETYATGSNTRSQIRPDGTRDSRYGVTDSYFVMDLATSVQLTDWAKLLGGVKNITGDEYVVSRIPHGPRPGAPRLFYVGAEVEF